MLGISADDVVQKRSVMKHKWIRWPHGGLCPIPMLSESPVCFPSHQSFTCGRVRDRLKVELSLAKRIPSLVRSVSDQLESHLYFAHYVRIKEIDHAYWLVGDVREKKTGDGVGFMARALTAAESKKLNALPQIFEAEKEALRRKCALLAETWIRWSLGGSYGRMPDVVPEVGKAEKYIEPSVFTLGDFQTELNLRYHITTLYDLDPDEFSYVFVGSIYITRFEDAFWVVGSLEDEGIIIGRFARRLTTEESMKLDEVVRDFEAQKDLIRRKHAVLVLNELDPESVSKKRENVLRLAGLL